MQAELLDTPALFETFRSDLPETFGLHLDRLEKSAQTLGFSFPYRAEISARLSALPDSLHAIRIFLFRDHYRLSLTLYTTPHQPSPLTLTPATPLDLPAAHKHTLRKPWVTLENKVGTELIFHANGHLLETSRAAIVARIDGQLYTPPQNLDLLPSITCRRLIESGQVLECPIPVAALARAELFVASALRGLHPAILTGVLDGSGSC